MRHFLRGILAMCATDVEAEGNLQTLQQNSACLKGTQKQKDRSSDEGYTPAGPFVYTRGL